MKKLLALLVLCGAAAACVPIQPPPPPPPPPATKVTVGDSNGLIVGSKLTDAVNDAAGGSTVCDTAASLPDVGSKVYVNTSGHSWSTYDAATAQRCLLDIVDHYPGKTVFVATTPQPLAIFCLYGSYEYDLRIRDFDTFKRNVVSRRSNVRIVEFTGFEHTNDVGQLDCEHLTDHGADQAVAALRARGF